MSPAVAITAPPAAPHDVQRGFALLLKQRWRVLSRLLAAHERDGLKLAPALFICSFDFKGLKSDAPGVERVRPLARFATFAARLKVPSPAAHQSGRRLVGALLVLHDERVARVLVQPAESISTHLVARVAERCAAANELYARAGVPVRFELLRPGALDVAALARLYELGGCIAGRPAKWLADAAHAAHLQVTARQRFDWVPHGPTPLSQVQLLLGWQPQLDAAPGDPFTAAVTLRHELLRALRRAALFDRPVFRAHLQRLMLPGRVPLCLVPALKAALPDVVRKRAPQLHAVHSQHSVELRLPDGSPFAKGRTLLQARVRAVLLAHAIWGHVPEAWLTGPQWKKLAQKLRSERTRTTTLFALGPEGSALCVKLKAGLEPRMRELDADATLRRVVSAAASGHHVEIVPCSQLQELEAMRLSQLAWRAAVNAAGPVAVQSGDHVLVFDRGRFRRLKKDVFYGRPRRAVLLDVAPATRTSAGLGTTVECVATPEGDRAVVAYRCDGVGFQERVALDELQSHLQTVMRICQATAQRTMFVLQLDDALAKVLKTGRAQTAPPTPLEVKGDLVRGLQVVIGEQTFGSRELRAAAETILSGWQVGVRGQLDVRAVHVGVNGMHSDAMHRLYARSLIVRRLWTHIDVCVGLNGSHDRVEI